MRSTKPHRVFGRLLLGIVVLTAGAASCSRGERVLGDSLSADGDDDTPTFVAPPDAEAPEAAVELTAYCPSNKCPAGRTTCPSSPFLCDVDLLTDRNNCGACGAVCPSETSREYYECVEGRCMLQCKSQPVSLDCDGVPDNGCETTPTNNEHCGACGNKCADQAKPCVQRSPIVGDVGCGCKGDDLLCTTPTLRCVKARSDDSNCGACGRVCDPNGDGGVQYANTYYGCFDGQCGALKCRPNFGNCDGDKLNGCEADFLSAEHCGGCGNACGAGQECRLDLSGTPQCMCPAGKTFCATQCVGN
ncbi:MAG: hypothetical protein J0I07_33390, partial [Myxococcales bacterium]|nr:hypothetical protein [Myxococcales bacterium]